MTTGTKRTRPRAVVLVVLAAVVGFGPSRTVSAHTDFESSVPADGAVVDGPLGEIIVNFTNPSQPAGAGFELLGPDDVVRAPTTIDETDGTSFVLSFDPPLAAGTYGVRWSVRAGDAHPIDGSFRFDVAGATPIGATTTTGTATTTVTPSSAALEQFLDTDSATDGSVALGRFGRMMTMISTVFGVGVLAALRWVIRGSRDELFALVGWVRLAALAMFTGGLVEYAALVEGDPSASAFSAVGTKAGTATILKMVGGLAVGFNRWSGRTVRQPMFTNEAGSEDPDSDTADALDDHRWKPTSATGLGLLGVTLVMVSFWFDGHTVSTGPWPVHAFVDLVHLGAAAVWAGGVLAMTTVVWMRHRRSGPLGLAPMVVRFSSLATVSSVAVIVAGIVMVWLIVETPGDLFGTEWGRVLIVKTALVVLAGAMGAFNHFHLRPALEHAPDDPLLAVRLRRSLSFESIVFVAIVAVTAVLVASAT